MQAEFAAGVEMTEKGRRYYVIPDQGDNIVCHDDAALASRFALEFGEGTHVVDTRPTQYYPMAQRVEDGELVFLEYGGWPEAADLGDNLIEAAKKGYAPIVRAFLVKGADVDARDRHGATALIWAAAGGDLDSVRLLIDFGADVGAADGDGATAIDLAWRKGRSELVILLDTAMIARKIE